MDIATTFYGWTPKQVTATGKPSRRRSYSDRDWIRDFYEVCEMFDGNENAWDAVERHERLG